MGQRAHRRSCIYLHTILCNSHTEGIFLALPTWEDDSIQLFRVEQQNLWHMLVRLTSKAGERQLLSLPWNGKEMIKKTQSQEQCCKPVKPALGKLRGTGFGVRGQLGSNRKTVRFQTGLAVWVVAQR